MRLEGASVTYEGAAGERSRALDDVTLSLDGGVTGLMGQTGSGKSTLLEVLAGVLPPDSGRLLVDGADALRGPGARRLAASVGLVFQIPERQFFESTVEREVCFGLLARGAGAREARERAASALALMGLDLDEIGRRSPFALSGGQQRRVAIASVLVLRPALLLLDEPTAGLDPKERVRFRNLIASMAQDRIVLLSTHIVSDVEYIADRILVMRSGAFVLQGTPDSVVAQAAGKVWECHVEAREADALAQRTCVANVHYAPDGHAVVRSVGDEPPVAGAVPLEPTLEDLYLYIFRDQEPAGALLGSEHLAAGAGAQPGLSGSHETTGRTPARKPRSSRR